MTDSVNTRGAKSFTASLALHVLIGTGLALSARAPAKNAAALAAPRSAAWSGDTFEVAELVRPASPASEPEPSRDVSAAESSETAAPAADARRSSHATPAALPAPSVVPAASHRHASESPPPSVATPAGSATAPGATPPPSAAGSAPPEATTGGARAGIFGAAGLAPGVRNLAAAFCRAIPPATRADAAWQTLPLGSAGSLWALIVVDDSGRIVSAEPDPERHRSEPAAPHMKRLLERTVLLLGGGAFALSAEAGAGTEKLSIEVELGQREPSEDAEPGHMTSQGHEPPTPAKAGRAYFTLGSGRHFEARVTIVGK